MKLGVYSVYDAGVKAFLPPFHARAKGEALRSFADACSDQAHMFAKHASDFSLFWLGEFDDSSGTYECPLAPDRVIGATEVIALESSPSR